MLAPIRDDVAAAVAHFVSFEVGLIDTPCRIRPLAAVWHGTPVTVVRMEAIVHVAVEIGSRMKPRASANEDASNKPLRAVVTSRSAVIRSNVVVSVGTLWCYSDVDAYLCVRSWGDYGAATSSDGN